MKFSGIQKTSLIDFPDRVATVLFTPGCNLRCPYCHNWRLVIDPTGPFLPEEEALKILEERKRFVDAVAITGGEPTLQADLPRFLQTLKERGYAVKLDTNGIIPEALKECLLHVDYVAVDVKTSPDMYMKLGAESVEGLLRTIDMLKHGTVDYEFRCTVVPGFINEETIHMIGEIVEGARLFAFQQFVPGDTLDPNFTSVKPYSRERISYLADIMARYVDEVTLRI
jgi:pyruvate formate lyase activating enzyme